MSDDAPTEVKASPPASEDAGRAPAEAQGKPRPTGRFKRTLKAVADSDFVEWLLEWVVRGVLVVAGIGALWLFSLIAADVVDSVGNWLFSNLPADLAITDLVVIGLVLLAAVCAIPYFLWRAAMWLTGKFRARRGARARSAADRQADMPRSCRADHRASDEPGGGVDLAGPDRGSAKRWAGWVVFAVLLGPPLVLLRRRADR